MRHFVPVARGATALYYSNPMVEICVPAIGSVFFSIFVYSLVTYLYRRDMKREENQITARSLSLDPKSKDDAQKN